MPDEVKVGDRLEDPEGSIWTVVEVLPDAPPRHRYRLERMKLVEAWVGADLVGVLGGGFRRVKEASDAI